MDTSGGSQLQSDADAVCLPACLSGVLTRLDHNALKYIFEGKRVGKHYEESDIKKNPHGRRQLIFV